MDEVLKKRLIGAAVLSSLAVIFVPMLFEEPPPDPPALPPLPPQPVMRDLSAELLRDPVPEIKPLAPRAAPPPVDTPPPAAAPAPVVAAAEPKPEPVKKVQPKPKPQPQTTAGPSAWVVQVGSFSSRDNAGKLVAKLRAAKLPTPDPEAVEVRGKRYYRVQVGPVIERAEAERMVSRVDAVSGTKSAVRRYP